MLSRKKPLGPGYASGSPLMLATVKSLISAQSWNHTAGRLDPLLQSSRCALQSRSASVTAMKTAFQMKETDISIGYSNKLHFHCSISHFFGYNEQNFTHVQLIASFFHPLENKFLILIVSFFGFLPSIKCHRSLISILECANYILISSGGWIGIYTSHFLPPLGPNSQRLGLIDHGGRDGKQRLKLPTFSVYSHSGMCVCVRVCVCVCVRVWGGC